MKESKYTWWGRIREKGKKRYILLNGVLLFGVPMLIFMSFISDTFTNGFFSEKVLVHGITWLVAGLVYGFTMWHWFEHKYSAERVKQVPGS